MMREPCPFCGARWEDDLLFHVSSKCSERYCEWASARQKGREWAEERWKKWQGAAIPIDDDLWKEGPASLLNPTPMPALGTVEAMDAARERWAELYAARKASQPIQAPALAKETAPNFHNPPPPVPAVDESAQAPPVHAPVNPPQSVNCPHHGPVTERLDDEPFCGKCKVAVRWIRGEGRVESIRAMVGLGGELWVGHHGRPPDCSADSHCWVPLRPHSTLAPKYSPPYVSKPCPCGLTGGCWCPRES